MGSTTLLKGPFLGFFPIRNNRDLSSWLSELGFLRLVREKTAGTAERCDMILDDVSWDVGSRGSDLRTIGHLMESSRK